MRSDLADGLGRLFAGSYDPISTLGDRWFLRPHREAIVQGLEGRVLDLGAGTGWSFEYLDGCAGPLEVHAIEPDAHMRRRARRRAAALELDITIYSGVGEHLPFETDSFDAVLASLVLCTVADQEAVHDEIARILGPGGELRMLEHVRGDGLRGRLQRFVAPAWSPVAGGCDLTRRQHESYLSDPRFVVESIDTLAVGLFPIKPFVRASLSRRASEESEQ